MMIQLLKNSKFIVQILKKKNFEINGTKFYFNFKKYVFILW